jgi:para-nitrobenzyl esterase
MPESFSDGSGFGPNVDGFVLPKSPIEMFRTGDVNAVPLLIGTTTDEFSTMAQTILTKVPANDADMKAQLTPRFGAQSDLIMSKYPAASYRSPSDAVIHVWSDSAIVCPVRILTRAVAAEQPGRVWRFVFAHAYASPEIHVLGAGHGLELPLLFRDLPEKFQMNSDELDLAKSFTDMVERFVWTGNPNGGKISWPAFDNETSSYLELDTPPSIKQNVRATECDFWEAQWNKPSGPEVTWKK